LKLALFHKFSLFDKTNEKNCLEEQRIFDLTREVVCYNQGKIVEYYFLHDRYQSELASIISKILSSKQIETDLQSKLIKIYHEYNSTMAEHLNKIVGKNLSFADEYFLNRSTKNVRSCIKILDKNLNVVDPFRKNEKKKYKYNKNTGFQRLIDHNKKKNRYICPNIPEFVAKGNYKNIRIIEECVKKYFESQKTKNVIKEGFKKIFFVNNKDNIDDDWISCWKGYNNEKPNAEDCYKSTLIIPMTFKNNSLSIEFTNYLEEHEERRDKTTLGFLCFDHINIEYFNEERDTNFCYKIADLVSLYLLKDFIAQNNKQYKFIETIVKQIEKDSTFDIKKIIQKYKTIKN